MKSKESASVEAGKGANLIGLAVGTIFVALEVIIGKIFDNGPGAL